MDSSATRADRSARHPVSVGPTPYFLASTRANEVADSRNVAIGAAMTKHAFEAEVSQILRLVVHSLYSHHEIFLRELVSNASDALDRLRFRAVTDPGVTENDTTMEIRLRADPDSGVLRIEDT